MRLHFRTLVVLALIVGLLALFLNNVDLRIVGNELVKARLGWLALSLATMFANLAIRALRWQFLLEPLGKASFVNAFRATAVGFAANTVLPARAGEVIRPYFLSRHEPMTATGAFATIILERLLDLVTVLALLAAFVFLFAGGIGAGKSALFTAVKWAGATAGAASLVAVAVLFVLAGNPERLIDAVKWLERVLPPGFNKLAKLIVRMTETFALGLGTIRRPRRLLVALAWSFPLWLSIDAGIWAAAVAFGFDVPFTGSFLIVPLLVLGVAVPTPGAIGGFHEAFRLGTTVFYRVPNDSAVAAALVLHLFSVGPSLLLGLFFAAQSGLNLAAMWQVAGRAQEGGASR